MSELVYIGGVSGGIDSQAAARFMLNRYGAARVGPVVTTVTIGWEPSCISAAEVKPCTVLDPFNGAGTTGLVALRLGRNYIGIELNPEYIAMSERRIREDAPLFRQGGQQ